MRFKNSTALLSVSFAALTASPALADITADDVWNSYQALAQSIGGELTATINRDGNNVEFSDTKLQIALPGDELAFVVLYPTLSYTENGDGTVSMDLNGPQTYGFTMSGLEPAVEAEAVELLINYDNAEMVASGDPDDITYAYAMDGFEFEISDLIINAAEGADIVSSMIKGSGDAMKGSSRLALGDLITLAGQSETSEIRYSMKLEDANGSVSTTTGSYEGMVHDSTITLPTSGMSIMNLAAALHNGLSVEATGTYGGSTSTTTVELDGSEVSSQTMTTGSSSSVVSANADGIQITADGSDIAFDFQIDEGLPIAIDGGFGRMSADFLIPVSMSEEPQDFTMAFGFEGIKLGEGVWGMFDPVQVLPRDAAALTMNLTGKTTLLQDLLNFTEMAQLSHGDMPAQLNEITINDLQISAAGANLSATGDFAFNNDDLVSFGGMPAPSGTTDVQISGANALIDKLIQMGLMSDSDAMGARMMMGMFTVPGEGDDTMSSNIEVTEDGQVLANGQRIK